MRARILSVVILVAAASAAAVPALADDTPKFKIFGGASYVSPMSEEEVDIGVVRDSVRASDDLGWTVGFEARFNRFVGLEMDYVNATNDVEFGGAVIGQVEMQPLSATLDFHVVPAGVVDFYLGPTVSYFIWTDATLDPVGDLHTENEWAYGASLGLEVGGERIAFLGGLRWLSVDFKSDVPGNFAVDPLFSRVGLAIRF